MSTSKRRKVAEDFKREAVRLTETSGWDERLGRAVGLRPDARRGHPVKTTLARKSACRRSQFRGGGDQATLRASWLAARRPVWSQKVMNLMGGFGQASHPQACLIASATEGLRRHAHLRAKVQKETY